MDKNVRRQLIFGCVLTAVSLSLLRCSNTEKELKVISYERNYDTGEIKEKELNLTTPSNNRVLKK